MLLLSEKYFLGIMVSAGQVFVGCACAPVSRIALAQQYKATRCHFDRREKSFFSAFRTPA
jgi:hypothetical protein